MSYTLVTFLLDKSGSMQRGIEDTIGAFNTYLYGLRESDSIQFTLLQFDSFAIEKTYVNMTPKDIPGLTRETFIPRGGTPLIDAAYKTIRAVERQIENETISPKVVICIQTDGEENESREHKWDDLSDLIKEKTALGWEFIFMGASIDAYQQGARMGIQAMSTVSYDSHDPQAMELAFAFTASNTALYASGARAHTGYTTGQKKMSGDKFDEWVNQKTNPQAVNGLPSNSAGKATSGAKPAATNPAIKRRPIVDDIDLGPAKCDGGGSK